VESVVILRLVVGAGPRWDAYRLVSRMTHPAG